MTTDDADSGDGEPPESDEKDMRSVWATKDTRERFDSFSRQLEAFLDRDMTQDQVLQWLLDAGDDKMARDRNKYHE